MRVRLARRSGAQRLPPESMTPSQMCDSTGDEARLAGNHRGLGAGRDEPAGCCQHRVPRIARGGGDLAIRQFAARQAKARAWMCAAAIFWARCISTRSARRPSPSWTGRSGRAGQPHAASILDNARLVERERERQRRNRNSVSPGRFSRRCFRKASSDLPHLSVSGLNCPCSAVGGDYFDVFHAGQDKRTAVPAGGRQRERAGSGAGYDNVARRAIWHDAGNFTRAHL